MESLFAPGGDRLKALEFLGPAKPQALSEFLSLSENPELDDLFERALLEPVRDLFQRPKKNLREQLVRLGFMMARDLGGPSVTLMHEEDLFGGLSEILEILHAGSLIVDDIEDGSEMRRGRPCLHQVYGLPVALNAGNWLYFLPFQMIERLPLSPERRAALSTACQKMLFLAHYGQALDVGVPADTIEQERLPQAAQACMELKSGVLTGFALKAGAVVQNLDSEQIRKLDGWGRRFGTALQMLDDVGNLSSNGNPAKKLEDFRLKRLCHVLAVSAKTLSPENYRELWARIENLSTSSAEILEFLAQHEIPPKARAEACLRLSELAQEIASDAFLSEQTRNEFLRLQKKLVSAYE